MQFSKLLVAAAAFAGANAAYFTNTAFNLTAGQTFTITWANPTGPVTLLFKGGSASALTTVSTIATGLPATTTSYAFQVPSNLNPDQTYAFEIDDPNPNYSLSFTIAGESGSASSSSASSASSVLSSLSSSVSSQLSSASTSSASASKSTATTTSSSTTASSTSSKTSSASASSSSTSAPSSGATVASPLALVFVAFAAIIGLH